LKTHYVRVVSAHPLVKDPDPLPDRIDIVSRNFHPHGDSRSEKRLSALIMQRVKPSSKPIFDYMT
ncbi:MAG: hypothetical protein P8X46_08910, partial [Nitrospirales bacterium]